MQLEHLYYLLLLLATISSFLTAKEIPGLRVLRLLLIAGVVSEILFNVFLQSEISSLWVYNVYIPIECFLMVLFYSHVRKTAGYRRLSLGLLTGYFIFIGFYFFQDASRLYQVPSLIYNLSVIIQVVLATIALVFIEPKDDISILDLPEFWILSAIIIFYSGVFVFNGIATHSDTSTYQYLHNLIVKSLNILFYVTLISVFLWKPQAKK